MSKELKIKAAAGFISGLAIYALMGFTPLSLLTCLITGLLIGIL